MGFKNTSRSGSDQIWLVFFFFSSIDLSATGSISTKTHVVTSVVLVSSGRLPLDVIEAIVPSRS